MSFSDEIKKAYVPKDTPPKLSQHELRVAKARTLLAYAKKELLYNSKHGKVTEKYVGIGIRKVKVVEATFGFGGYEGGFYDGDYCGISGTNEFDMRAIFSIVQELSKKEGIHVERYSGKFSSYKNRIRFWVEV